MKSLTHLWITLSTYLTPPSRKDDTGATMIEYAAVLLIVAAIAFAIYQLPLADNIRGAIDSSVSRILQGPGAAPENP